MKLFNWSFGKSLNVKMSKKEFDTMTNLVKKAENEFGINILPKKHAGVVIDNDSAMGLDTVYACIRDKSESIGQLPGQVYQGKKLLSSGNRLHKIFTLKPNDYMTLQDLVEMYVTSMESNGKFYAYVLRNKFGNVAEIIPFRYQRGVGVNMDSNGRVYYTYSTNDGKPAMGFNRGDLMHIKLNTTDGFNGLSPIKSAARTIGIAIAQEEYLDNQLDDGYLQKGYLATDMVFNDVANATRLRNQWSETNGGVKKSTSPALLENGVKWVGTGISPADVDLITQRKFSREQICSIFRVPPGRIGVIDAMKYKNLEENNRSYLRDSLMPLITKIETAMSELLPEGYSFKLNVKEFTRGDRKSQVEAVGSEIKVGIISLGEGREELGYERKEGDDVHAIDTNNLSFGLLTDIPKLQAERMAQPKTPAPIPKEGN